MKEAGAWNRLTVRCVGPYIDVLINGQAVISMDMRMWTNAKKNPDGSSAPPCLSKPLSAHPTQGKIGLQGKHAGASVWFRNMKIKEL